MGGFERLERFDDVDATGEQERFAAFLDLVDGIADVVARRRRSYTLLGGGPVVDVGCGTGTAVRELATRHGTAIGVDASAAMLAVARERAGGAVSLHLAGADALPLPDGAVAGYRAERLYQHLADPAAALAEAHRVLAPGGRIVLVDQDWELLAFAGDDPATERAVVAAFSASLVAGRAGREARGQLLDAGFDDVHAEADAVVSTSWADYGMVCGLVAGAAAAGLAEDAVAGWLAEQERRAAAGRFQMTMVHMLTSATRR